MIVWAWTRLYVLALYIIDILKRDDGDYDYLGKLFGIFLSVLYILHVYWFFMFINMGLRKAKTGVAEDIVNQKKKN